MAALPDGELSIAFDLHGCPNRCRLCRLGCAAGAALDPRLAVERLRAYRDRVASGNASAALRRIRFHAPSLREPRPGSLVRPKA
jgi:hypothetical protein